MKAQTKFITSHRVRVARANELINQLPERISIIDREAYVEFFLLEDIVRLYEYRLNQERKKNVETKAGEMTKERNIRKFSAIINIFKSAIEIAWGEISSGNYRAVWSSIPEHALMVAANSLKYLPKLRMIAVKMLKNLSTEALDATNQSVVFDESLEGIEDHEVNVRAVKNLPSEDEINAIIRVAEDVIPDDKVRLKKDESINTNI